MLIEFDADKDAVNIAKHGLSLSRAIEMDIATIIEDRRRDYGEPRFLAFGWIEGSAHSLAFTLRGGAVRAISLRRAHRKEMDRHGAGE